MQKLVHRFNALNEYKIFRNSFFAR